MNKLMILVKGEEGQSLVEYGLILAIVALGVSVALGTLREKISALFTKLGNELGKQGKVGGG